MTSTTDLIDLDEDLSELDEMIEESKRDAFDELDDLLNESVVLHQAKKAKSTGKKLTAEQEDALAANALTQEIQTWKPFEAIAHFVDWTCDCGCSGTRLSAWYIEMHHRNSSAKKLVKAVTPGELPRRVFRTPEAVGFCANCLNPDSMDKANAENTASLLSSFRRGQR